MKEQGKTEFSVLKYIPFYQ